VPRGAPISTLLGERVAACQVHAGAVQGTLAIPPGADVAEGCGHPRRITNAREVPQAFAPALHGGVGARATKRAVAFGSYAVANDFLASRLGRPTTEAPQYPYEKRVAPCLGPSFAQTLGAVESGIGEALRESRSREGQESVERFARVVRAAPHGVTEGGCHHRGLRERLESLRGGSGSRRCSPHDEQAGDPEMHH